MPTFFTEKEGLNEFVVKGMGLNGKIRGGTCVGGRQGVVWLLDE